ncbi:hypothetical protein PAXRUDRAFT_166713 [Paxillus rubicundulus Ve08.2h10]|uniref:Uncharacterized protein n=1 Tax=Paxillus rubicundulus Ve08.2h10 TaxID=930991 RepID=A0A0D0CQ50_9AGAM|nr:hypothetical protein PAXRUDRAFT_166713 [Paxillus rubicundulus Ve08.2h10]
MCQEHIQACPHWRNNHPQYDCIFINTNLECDGMAGMTRAWVLFSFKYDYILYPCVIAFLFNTMGNTPDENTGMWMVHPAFCANHTLNIAMLHIDAIDKLLSAIYHAAHLIPIYGCYFVPMDIKYYHSYDAFHIFYVNKYADHHACEIAF